MLTITLGVFLCTGVAAASDVATLQPASDITYNENVTIKGSLNTDSLRVGTAGQGGVTFFNGTVLNEGPNDPFTVGDDLRVDGYFYRMEVGPPNPIKVADSMVPVLDDANDLGSSSNRWRNIYAKNGNFSENLTVNGVTGLTDADIPNNITASNYLLLSGGSITGNLTVSGKINGLDITKENSVYYKSEATPALIEPTPNPTSSKIITGVANMPVCTSGWSKKIIDLPNNFFTDTGSNKWSSYTVTATPAASGGATPAFRPFDSVGIMKYDNDTFAIFGECAGLAANYNYSGLYWTAIGY